MKFNTKFIKILSVCMCISISSVGVAFADTTQKPLIKVMSSLSENDLLQKQKEIDQYIFIDHVKEFEGLDFKVAYIGQVENYVEIGISPYNDTNANYIYEIFGKENIKVVEGEQAVLMATTGVSTDEAISTTVSNQPLVDEKMLEKQAEIDKYLFVDHKEDVVKKGITVTHTAPNDDLIEIGIMPFNQANADYLYELFGKDTVKIVEGTQAVPLKGNGEIADTVSKTTTDTKNEKSNNILPIIIGICAIVLISALVVFSNKHKSARR